MDVPSGEATGSDPMGLGPGLVVFGGLVPGVVKVLVGGRGSITVGHRMPGAVLPEVRRPRHSMPKVVRET